MEECGFPVIPRYLEKQRFPEDAIPNAKVTHVWAQDKRIAAHIARASRIEHVVNRYTDMIGQVDAVLLARDDAETHYEFAAPFLRAGLPIYVDKPLALSVADARRMFELELFPGQLYSCSAMRYAKEFKLTGADRASLGRILHIHGIIPKDWAKYAVHVIEPLLLLAEDRGRVKRCNTIHSMDSTTLVVEFSSGFNAVVSTMGSGAAPFSLRVIGDSGWKDLLFSDTYFAFKSALFEFVQSVIYRDVRIDKDSILEVCSLVEAGMG